MLAGLEDQDKTDVPRSWPHTSSHLGQPGLSVEANLSSLKRLALKN